MVRLRTNFRKEDVYLYRLQVKPETVRKVLLDYLREINRLKEQAKWYNALTGNCTTSIPLQTDITIPLAYRLNDPSLWTRGQRRFLTGAEVPLRVLLIQPYESDRIPVVFVHSLSGSPLVAVL